MTQRTQTEKVIMATKAMNALSKEALELYDKGETKHASVILDFLSTASIETLAVAYDVVVQNKGTENV